jgi:pimeloyl-ACP methyl ester carboxylesterase
VKSRGFKAVSILLFVLLFLMGVVVIAGAIAKSNLKKEYPAPGQMVDVGGYRLHLNCQGQGDPTIILESGWSDFSVLWTLVQPEVAKFTRVCSYDRAGTGWSEISPKPRTAEIMVDELHTLLATADVPGPFVLVGHSMGGVLMRVYAHDHPEDVVGLVLVDSVHEEQFTRYPSSVLEATQEMLGQFRLLGWLRATGLMALLPQSIPNRGLSNEALAQYRAVLATTNNFEAYTSEWNTLEESYDEVLSMQITDLGALPLIVLSRGLADPSPILSDTENQQLWEIMQGWQTSLLGLSTTSRQVIAEKSLHHIQLDQPDLVIEAVREMVDKIGQ